MRLVQLPEADPYHMTFATRLVAMLAKKLQDNIFALMTPTKKPFISVGYHEEISRVINLKLTNELGIQVIRRDTGGGAVIITPNQQGYRIGINELPSRIQDIYSTFLSPVLELLKEYGNPQLRGQDILFNGKKISGNGAVTYDNVTCITGSIILKNDIVELSNLLNIPSEKFKDKIAKSIQEWVTGLSEEIGREVTPEEIREKLRRILITKYNAVPYELSEEDMKYWDKVSIPEDDPGVDRLSYVEGCFKVTSRVFLCNEERKFRKMVNVTVRLVDDKIDDVVISGDYFVEPRGIIKVLESSLKGKSLQDAKLMIRDVLKDSKIYGFSIDELSSLFDDILKKYLQYK